MSDVNNNHKCNYFMFSNNNTVKFAWSTRDTPEQKLKKINKKVPKGGKFNLDVTIPKENEKDLLWCDREVKSILKNGLIKPLYNEYDCSKCECSSDVLKKIFKIITGPRVNSQDPRVKQQQEQQEQQEQQQQVISILKEEPKPVNIHRYVYCYICETGFNIRFVYCYISETGFNVCTLFQ